MHSPYWYLLATCCVIAAFVNALVLCYYRIGCPKVQDMKWVLTRALFENFHWMLAILSVLVGAAPGDVAALTSIDIIAAAILGLLFLGERVSILHLVALVLSVAGAICVSQPQFIFGSQEADEARSPVGYCMAMLSGCFQACSFVCARKSAHIPVSLLTFVSLLCAIPLAVFAPLLPDQQGSFQPVVAAPWMAVGLISILTVWSTFSIIMPAAGATRCPAAVSATVFTSSSMVTGYVAQTLLFNDMPKPLKIFGAACMLASVIIMAVRCQAEETDGMESGRSADMEENPATQDDETLSLGSFVASEVSFGSSSSRLRRRYTTSEPSPRKIGKIGACLPVLALSQMSS
mmetsp:Transcript_58468/g.109429  ORF Transcript_58468/g.109429 Transcript_58468/m.109429 type:complete len:347 (-) Transcript_58468:208-1248(-)